MHRKNCMNLFINICNVTDEIFGRNTTVLQVHPTRKSRASYLLRKSRATVSDKPYRDLQVKALLLKLQTHHLQPKRKVSTRIKFT